MADTTTDLGSRIDEPFDRRSLAHMEMYCADCGCLVERGVRLIPCDASECCCVDLPSADPMETIAARVRTALNDRDMDALRALIAEDARWGEGGRDDTRTCHNRNEIIATYKRLLDQGVRGTVTETTTGPGGVACLVEIEWPDDAPNRRGPTLYQVFLVTDGLVTGIQGHDDRDLAVAAISS
jgi:SnoaL-like domain